MKSLFIVMDKICKEKDEENEGENGGRSTITRNSILLVRHFLSVKKQLCLVNGSELRSRENNYGLRLVMRRCARHDLPAHRATLFSLRFSVQLFM